MIKILQAALLLLLIQVYTSCKSDKNSFQITGTIKDTTFDLLYLEELPLATNQPVVVDSVRPDPSGKFTLRAPATEDRVFFIRPSTVPYPLFIVVNDNKKIQVDVRFEGQKGELSPVYTITGSPASQLLQDFSSSFNEGMRKISTLASRLDSTTQGGGPDTLIRRIEETILARASALKTDVEVQLNRAPSPSTYILILSVFQSAASNPKYGLQSYTIEELNVRLDKLGSQFPKHTGLAAFRKNLDDQIQKSIGLVGQLAPEFALPDANGKPVPLNSFRGKWVLVDFWASWCKPCRMENPTVVAAYQRFKNKNFTVLGVSLDREEGKQDWLNAIEDDKLDWTHVSDLKFWNSGVVPLYNIEGIPYNVLVDPQGKVVAENLRGPDLERKLKEVLK